MYPVRYTADFAEQRNRWTTFFRWLLVIPWYILASVYSLAAFVVAFLAWFAIVFAGRYPESFYNFNAGFLRFAGRVNGWFNLQTDEWPPFGFEQGEKYPIRIEIDPPLEKYNRWKTLFRLIVGIPAMFIVSLMGYMYPVAAAIAWLHIVFRGHSSGGIHNVLSVGMAYTIRTTAYFLLLTETLPPVSDQAPAGSLRPSGGGAAAKAKASAATAAKAPAKRATAAKPAAKKPAARKPAAKKKPPPRKRG